MQNHYKILLQNIISTVLQTKNNNLIQSILVGKVIGGITSIGIFSIISLIGTASTGTAIATLSGIALTNATLYWLGGSIFMGTVILFIIVSISGYIASRYYNGKIKNIINLSNETKDLLKECNIIIKNIDNLSDIELDKQIQKLIIHIYIINDKIIQDLSPKYKLSWSNNRLKLINLFQQNGNNI